MRRLFLSLTAALGLAAAPVAAETADAPAGPEMCEGCAALLELAAASPVRKSDRARDSYRHPVETLSFFGVRPDMKVGEYAPGGGWYTRMLAPYLGKQGHVTGLFFDTGAAGIPEGYRKSVPAQVEAFPAKFASAEVPAGAVSAMSLDAVPDGEKGTYDRVLVIRMMHNLMRWNAADSELATMRDLLKPGGMLGIVQHRAKADAPYALSDGNKGYLREADVIAFVESQGFELVAKSEVNANPKDTADWEGGVWTLPPSLALKEQDKAKYEAIGESDRMTLLFRKRP
jgi:predicted methyltransferase